MATITVPKLGEFPTLAVIDIDNVPVDSSNTGSRWLPSVYEGANYFAGGPQKLNATMGTFDSNDRLPYNPRTENNPGGNCAFSFAPFGRYISNVSSAALVHERIYNIDPSAEPLFTPNAASITNGGNPTMSQDTSYHSISGINTAYKAEIFRPVLSMGQTLPMSDTVPDPETLEPGQAVPILKSDGVFTNTGIASFLFDKPVTEPNPNWPPLPPPEIPIIYPMPALGIGAAAAYGFGYQVTRYVWESVPVEFIADPATCPANPTTDKVIIRTTALNPEGTPCAYDPSITLVRQNGNPMNAVAGRLVPEVLDITVDIFLTGKFFTICPPYRVTNNYYADETVNEFTVTRGNWRGAMAAAYWQVFQTDGAGMAKAFIGFGGSGISALITLQDDMVIDELFYSVPLSIGGSGGPFREWLANNTGMYPYSFGMNKNELIKIPRRSLEAIQPQAVPGYDDIFRLDESAGYASFSSFIGYAQSAYYVAGAGTFMDVENPDQIIFVLRDGKGWYSCDISEALYIGLDNEGDPEYDSVDYFAYSGGVMFIGSARYTEGGDPLPIKYRAVIPALPRGRLPRVVLEYQAVGMSFIPCQTHCLGKGGIISKV